MSEHVPSKEKVAPLVERLNLACVASCDCLVKTPVIHYHEPTCKYRVMQEAANALVALDECYDEFGIGAKVRTPSTLLANIQNSFRRSNCLSAIEREFFTKTVKDEDGEDTEECALNWGAEPEQYVEQFRAALAASSAHEPPDVLEKQRDHWRKQCRDLQDILRNIGECISGHDGHVFDDVHALLEQSQALKAPASSQPPCEDLELMRKDAARYEWLREHWSGIVTHTAPGEGNSRGMWVVTLIETMRQHRSTDPQTLDHAIDSAMDREDERSAPTKRGE